MHNIILKRANNAIRELQNLVNIKHTKNVCGKLIHIHVYAHCYTQDSYDVIKEHSPPPHAARFFRRHYLID